MTELMGAGDEGRAWRTIAFPVTSTGDGFEHLVADTEMTPGSAGRYVALCGRSVWAAALACPPGPRCPACITMHNTVQGGRQRHRRTDRRGVWARLTGRLRHPRSESESGQLLDLTLPLLDDRAPETTRSSHGALALPHPAHRNVPR